MDTVLIQEVLRYNTLLRILNDTLSNSVKVLQGLIQITAESEEVISNIRKNKIPKTWAKIAYPSLKSLSNYIKDLI